MRQIESEGNFPQADYAFDNGVLTLELTRLLEACGKHWVRELERTRLLNWHGPWRPVGALAEEMRPPHAASFRAVQARNRQGEKQAYWVFSKVVRLKKFGRKRLVLVHEKEDLSDAPRCIGKACARVGSVEMSLAD